MSSSASFKRTENRKRRVTVSQRDYHNSLERKRRQLISSKFKLLKDSLPEEAFRENFRNQKSSRCFILNTACTYVTIMETVNTKHKDDITQLKKENHELMLRIKQVEEGKISREDLKLLLLETGEIPFSTQSGEIDE